MEKEDLSGVMERFTMVNGRTIRKKAVEYGKVKEMFHMLENGMQIPFKDSVFSLKKIQDTKENSRTS